MKWIRWDNASHFELSDEIPKGRAYDDFIHHSHIVCEKDTNWREIESGTLNLEDGKLHITLKPLPEPEKLPTIIDLVNLYFETVWGKGYRDAIKGWGNSPLSIVTKRLVEAIDREEKKSPNPYTKEAVDELMYSLKEAGYEFAEQNPTSDQMRVGDYRRIYNAFQALLRQREAANVT